MIISPKVSYISGFTFIGALLIIVFIRHKNEGKKLADCAVYTLAKINRVYILRGQTRMVLQYSLKSKTVVSDEGVNSFNTNESWNVDRDKLQKRRLLVKVFCDDINIHRILWDNPVPDTLIYIPSNGWKNSPFEESE